MNFLSDHLIVRFDNTTCSVVIEHPNKTEYLAPLVQIRKDTYSDMSFDELSAFLGSRLLLLMPAMRAHFDTEIQKMSERD